MMFFFIMLNLVIVMCLLFIMISFIFGYSSEVAELLLIQMFDLAVSCNNL